MGPIGIVRDTIANKGIRGLYAGCTALVVGNAVKAGVRFLSYDQYKSMLTDADVSPFGWNPFFSRVEMGRSPSPHAAIRKHV